MRGGDIPINPPNTTIEMQNVENDDIYVAPPTDDELNAAFEYLQPLGVDDGITEIALTHYPITIDDLVDIYLHISQQPPYNRNWQNYDDARNATNGFTVNGQNFEKRDIANDILPLIGENVPMRPEMMQQPVGYGEIEERGMELEGGKMKKKRRKTRKRKSRKPYKIVKKRKTRYRKRD